MPDLMEVRVSQPAMSVIKVKNIRNSALLARLIPAAVMPKLNWQFTNYKRYKTLKNCPRII